MSTMIVANPLGEKVGGLQLEDSPVSSSLRKVHKPKKRGIRFHNTVFIKEIPSHRTYSAFERFHCWYSDDDYRCFKLSLYFDRFSTLFGDRSKTTRKTCILDETKRDHYEQHHNDCNPTQPRRLDSPDSTVKSLPMELPLYDDQPEVFPIDVTSRASEIHSRSDRDDIVSEKFRWIQEQRQKILEEEALDLQHHRTITQPDQIQQYSKMQQKIRLKKNSSTNSEQSKSQQKQQHRKPKFRVPPIHPKLKRKGGDKKSIDMSVRQAVPLSEDKQSTPKSRDTVTSSKMMRSKPQYQFKRSSKSIPVFSMKKSSPSPPTRLSPKSSKANTVKILDSALSMFQESSSSSEECNESHDNLWPNEYQW